MSIAESPETRDDATRKMRNIKEELGRRFDFDIRRIVEDARTQQQNSNRKILSAPLRQPAESQSDHS